MNKKRLFYDIETSFCEGWFYRPDWNTRIYPHQIKKHAKIISIHWSWEGEDKVHNLDWGLDKQCDKKMLKKFIKLMDSADEIIHYNGKKFDTPWIRQRAIFHGLEFKHTYNEVDCYSIVKKYLKQLPDKRLKGVCDYFGLPAKADAGGHMTWVNVIYHKDREALDHLLYYGDGDITSLKAVYYKLRPYALPNMHYGVLKGDGQKFHCPECSGLMRWNKSYTTRAGTVQHYMKCRDRSCGTYHKISNRDYMKYIEYCYKNNIK